ncbi:DUF2163 domain-containing protein [Novosphingobium terrae]|uniref:DUF2163 domain-containing protein n=1 Tax=Novosphingobium terrae TaxID=2726189 RepID=UPI00197CEBB5|nr:DUF2163 domain-containing protein [Novosphingobium terrae]
MSRIWFSQPLETVATWWRIDRRDGVSLGFTTHDADLWFDALLHRSAPGMKPAAIRRSTGFDADSAEVDGAIAHDSIAEADLVAGRYDGARVAVGLVDWQTLEFTAIYAGSIGGVTQDSNRFSAQLVSRKGDLARDPVPRTSPCCRADFCGQGCGLSAARFTHEAVLASFDPGQNAVTMAGDVAASLLPGGQIRWLDGPYAGLAMTIAGLAGDGLVLDRPLDLPLAAGLRAQLREGCDHTLATCAARFGNALNFRGEPFLPGNDMVIRYGLPS